ncbi:hypothetical protein BDY24DRAFT_402905 [Mrakia frigida]|uniref:uncharacterized protein n=1 Tax=Mrakia frigida TaxID=29902 RepID=UPI003FCC1370
MFETKIKTPARPPPLLSHIKTSPTLRHAHSTLLPSPLSEWTQSPATKASAWEEVKEREERLDRERADGRRARGRAIVRDFEWGVREQEGKRQRTKSLSTSVLVPPPHPETRRVSLGFQESLSPVLPTVKSSPALTTLLASSPAFFKFVRGSPGMKTSSSCSSLDEKAGGSRPPAFSYSFSSDPPSPRTNFSRPLSLGVPRLESPQSIGSSPVRTPVSSTKNRGILRKRSALGESNYHNSTPIPSSSLPPHDPFSSSITKTLVPLSATSTVSRTSRRRANTSAASTPTPRNQPPLDLALLSSCISLSLSSPALSSFDARSLSRPSQAHQHSSSSSASSVVVESPSHSNRAARSWTTSMSHGREKMRREAEERRRTEVELGLDEVMRLAVEVMEETED